MLIDEIKTLLKTSNNKEYRKFGITIGTVSILIAVLLLWREIKGIEYLISIGLAFILLGLIIPYFLKPIYIVWMSFAVLLGYIMTRVILTLLFGLIFIPVGLIIRVIGKDLLKEKIDHEAKSYWIHRDRNIFDRKSAEHQY